MTWKNAHKIADARRERVAALRLRGFSVREIISALAQEGVTNPETKKPFGIGTIARDLEYLKKEWQKNAARDIAEHRAEQLAELAELRKRNWGIMDLAEVRACLTLEAKILGTPAPEKRQDEVTGKDGGPIVFEDILTPEERKRRLIALLGSLETPKE